MNDTTTSAGGAIGKFVNPKYHGQTQSLFGLIISVLRGSHGTDVIRSYEARPTKNLNARVAIHRGDIFRKQ